LKQSDKNDQIADEIRAKMLEVGRSVGSASEVTGLSMDAFFGISTSTFDYKVQGYKVFSVDGSV
jgi:hypothetical protein